MSDSISELWERNKARSHFEPEEIAAVYLYKMVITDMMQQNGVSNDIIEACLDAGAELFRDIDREDPVNLVRFQSSVYSNKLLERMKEAMQIALDNNPALKRDQEGNA